MTRVIPAGRCPDCGNPEDWHRTGCPTMAAIIEARIAKLKAVRDAAEMVEIADGHTGVCRGYGRPGSRCTCGHDALRAALDGAKETP